MKLLELVSYFKDGGSFKEFCEKLSLNLESEVVEIFMTKPFHLENDLSFFEIEKTEGRVEFNQDGIMYHNLFDFYYFLGVIEESNLEADKSISNIEIAERLLSFAINDA